MTYLSTLNSAQKANLAYITSQLKVKGITNDFARAAILAVASKESSFQTKEEKGYGNTPNDRIRKIFGKYVSGLTEDELTALKKDDKKFFNRIYGGRYGNANNEGHLYRGRGFNQLTFKGNYEKVGKAIGYDLVKNPEMVNQVSIATAVLIEYFQRKLALCPPMTAAYYQFTDINSFKSLKDAVGAIYHANAGWGKSVSDIERDPTGGRKKTLERAPEFLEYVQK